jgi:hypothetical protein
LRCAAERFAVRVEPYEAAAVNCQAIKQCPASCSVLGAGAPECSGSGVECVKILSRYLSQ